MGIFKIRKKIPASSAGKVLAAVFFDKHREHLYFLRNNIPDKGKRWFEFELKLFMVSTRVIAIKKVFVKKPEREAILEAFVHTIESESEKVFPELRELFESLMPQQMENPRWGWGIRSELSKRIAAYGSAYEEGTAIYGHDFSGPPIYVAKVFAGFIDRAPTVIDSPPDKTLEAGFDCFTKELGCSIRLCKEIQNNYRLVLPKPTKPKYWDVVGPRWY